MPIHTPEHFKTTNYIPHLVVDTQLFEEKLYLLKLYVNSLAFYEFIHCHKNQLVRKVQTFSGLHTLLQEYENKNFDSKILKCKFILKLRLFSNPMIQKMPP